MFPILSEVSVCRCQILIIYQHISPVKNMFNNQDLTPIDARGRGGSNGLQGESQLERQNFFRFEGRLNRISIYAMQDASRFLCFRDSKCLTV
jgi:hypothetical protein